MPDGPHLSRRTDDDADLGDEVRFGLAPEAGHDKSALVVGLALALLSGSDAAIYVSNDPIRVETTALVKGNLLIVTFQSADARAKKDQVIALLKAATGRL